MKYLSLILILFLSWTSASYAQDTRAFYLSPYVGDGSDENPFKPAAFIDTPDIACIGLRPDPTVVDGYAICASSVISSQAGIISLGNSSTAALSGAKRTALGSALKGTITSTTVDRLLVDILGSKVRAESDGKKYIWLVPPGTAKPQPTWVATAILYDEFGIEDKGLVADLWNFQKEAVYLAYHYTLEPAVAWATTLSTETFNCADNASLTCVHTWTEFNNTLWAISSNTAAWSTAGVFQAAARNDSTLATASHEIQATLTSMTRTGASNTARCGPIGGKDSGATNSYYWFAARLDTSGDQYESAVRAAGTFSSIATNGQDPVNGDLIKLRISGTSITGLVNGTILVGPTTDLSITSSTYGGVAGSSNATTESCALDNWIGADYSTNTRRPSAPIIFQ